MPAALVLATAGNRDPDGRGRHSGNVQSESGACDDPGDVGRQQPRHPGLDPPQLRRETMTPAECLEGKGQDRQQDQERERRAQRAERCSGGGGYDEDGPDRHAGEPPSSGGNDLRPSLGDRPVNDRPIQGRPSRTWGGPSVPRAPGRGGELGGRSSARRTISTARANARSSNQARASPDARASATRRWARSRKARSVAVGCPASMAAAAARPRCSSGGG